MLPCSKKYNLSLQSWLKKFQITIDMGETFNKNRNPIAENVVKEYHKEMNKAGYVDTQIDEFQLALVLKNINSRIRDRGLTAKGMCFMRDQATNRNIQHKDCELKDKQKQNRERTHNKTKPIAVEYNPGDTVMIKDRISKVKPSCRSCC